MTRWQTEPDPLLRPYVHSYWGIARDLSPTGNFAITPDRFLELVFFVDPLWVDEKAGRRRLPLCTLISLLRAPLNIVADGVVRCASVRMQAWAAGLVFPEVNTSTEPWFDLTARFGREVPAVRDALQREAWREIVLQFDQMMRRALATANPNPGALAAAKSFAALPDEAADNTTGAVAAKQARSRRQIERQVRALTHLSPKQLASLTRFQFVRDTLWARPDVELAALAFESGYADQSHLTRHFRRYTGLTPGEFLRACAQLKTALRQQDEGSVAFLQDDLPPR